jgi:hypothetical protein
MDEQPDPGCPLEMRNQSQAASSLQAPLMTQDLNPAQRTLVDLMHVHKFGRIENMSVREGQPVFNCNVKVVRVARFGRCTDAAKASRTDEFELKREVPDLFAELMRLENGTVIRLEFRHGLPFLLETAATASS